jgi:Rrf2 family protein
MISNKCYYALKAMLELALHTGSNPVTIGEIARAQRMPVRFLEAILRQLKQAGLADSVRGKDGGYFLAKPARQIKVGAVIRIFEGPLFAGSAGGFPKEKSGAQDVFATVWREAEEALAEVYDNVTFADLAEKERGRQMDGVATYSI